MGKEKLPIKIFSKREKDLKKVEGGGNKDFPKWVLNGEKLKIRSDMLSKKLDTIENNVINRKYDFIPTVVKTDVLEEAKAKTHRKEIRKIFNTNENNLIGMPSSNELLIKINSKKDLDIIKNNIKNVEKNLYGISCIEDLEKFTPETIGNESSQNYKIKLIDYQNYEINSSVINLFEKIIKEKGFIYQKTNYTEKLAVFKIKQVTLDEINKIEEDEIYNSIFSIEPMPKYSITLDEFGTENEIVVKDAKQANTKVTVGVLDSGIEKNKYLDKWIDEMHYSSYPDNCINRKHGTFVSGIINYGDELEKMANTTDEAFKLLDATVFPDTRIETIDEDDLINNIKEAVKFGKDKAKIWNLSCGTSSESDTEKFSDFGIALDELQDEYNVLICKSVGNCENFVKGKPKSRISKSADSVRSIVVGSIAQEQSQYDIAKVNNPSPFTRIGRGPQYIIKPDVVHYGGNAGINDKGEIKINGVTSFSIDGSLSTACGTSFSTPRVTGTLAGIYSKMNEEFDPLLLKALVIHSSNYPDDITIPKDEIVNQYGYGVPKSVNDILYNSPYEVTLIMRDNIQKGDFIDIFQFPMPDCLIKDGYFQGQITATLVYNPILDASQISEYCQSNINIYLGTYDNLHERDVEKNNILNPTGRDGSKNVFSSDCYSKVKMKENASFLKERFLIENKDKYYPIKKYSVDLSEFTQTNKEKYLKSDKKWYMKLEGIYRDFIEQKASEYGEILNQEFCLVLTIKDPTMKENVYDSVSNKLDAEEFWHNTISINNNINVNIDN